MHEAAPGEVNTEELIEKAQKNKLFKAVEFLKTRLIFVKCYEKFFDREDHHLYLTNQGIEQMFGYLMPKKKTVVKMLIDLGADKPIVDGVGFHPGEGVVFTEGGDKYVNTYRARIPEPLKPTAEECKKIEWMFARIYDEAYRTWLLKFYAYVIQHPGVKIRSAPLIWSETQGNGKSMLTDRVPALLVGDQYHVQIGADVLEGTFNDALARAWHVSLSEFSGGSRRENDQVTKKVERWIIETKLELHQKNVGAATVPNHLFVTASSNKENAAAISNDDRKWGIHKMLAPALTEDEMAWIFEGFLNTERAPGVLRHYFLAVDTTGFNPSARAPLTAAKTEMAKSNEGADSELLENWLDEHTGPFAKDIVTITDVTDALRKNLHYGIRLRHVAQLLLRPPFSAEKRQIRWRGGKPWVYIVRNYKNHWRDAKESAIVAHLNDDDISVDEPLLT